MKRIFRTALHVVAVSALAAAGHAACAADGPDSAADPSVLVHTEPARTGMMADIVTAYGGASYSANSIMTLSLQQQGRVERIAVTPGEVVSTGQELIAFSASAQAASSFRQAQTALSAAQSQRLHTQQLLSQHLATRDQLAQAEKAVEDARSTLQALRLEGAGSPELNLKAPFDGVVQAIPVARGDRVQPGAPLLTLARSDGLVVTVGVEPALRSRVHPGQHATLVALQGAVGESSDGPPLSGQVLRVDGQLNPRTRLVDVDISLPAGALLAGVPVRADILVGQAQGWLVSGAALMQEGEAFAVYQVKNGRAVRVPVTLKGTRGNQDLVSGGLDPACPVVTDGAYQLADGATVRLQQTRSKAPS